MPKDKIVLIPLANITNKFDVRVNLDEDRVVQLAGMYEDGTDLPPVKVISIGEDKYAYIDGRHRGAARAYLNLPDVPAVVCNGSLRENPMELFAEALESNWGGAKPPTRKDIVHTIIRMLECGATRTAVKERLNFLPAGSARAYIADATSTITKRKTAKAMDAIAEGFTLEEAAAKYKVKAEIVKDVLTGKRNKWGKNRSDEVQFCTAVKACIGKEYSHTNYTIGQKIRYMLQKVEDGEISTKHAFGVIRAWEEYIRRSTVNINDWLARIEAIANSQDKAAGGTAA